MPEYRIPDYGSTADTILETGPAEDRAIVVVYLGKNVQDVLRLHGGDAGFHLYKWYLRLPPGASKPERVCCSKPAVSALYHVKLPDGGPAATVLCIQKRYAGKRFGRRWEAFVLLSEEDKRRLCQ